jgi:hypothetical protein
MVTLVSNDFQIFASKFMCKLAIFVNLHIMNLYSLREFDVNG